jgi:hypothetical protein
MSLSRLQPPGLSHLFPPIPIPFPFSGFPPRSCFPHCPLLPFLLHFLLFRLFQCGIYRLPFPLRFHMVLNQCAVSISEDGSSSRCVIVLLRIRNASSISTTAFTQPWITPSLFDNTGNPAIVDEWTFGLYQDRGAAEATLTQHWNTWITVSDFQEIAAAGCVLGCTRALQCAASAFLNPTVLCQF